MNKNVLRLCAEIASILTAIVLIGVLLFKVSQNSRPRLLPSEEDGVNKVIVMLKEKRSPSASFVYNEGGKVTTYIQGEPVIFAVIDTAQELKLIVQRPESGREIVYDLVTGNFKIQPIQQDVRRKLKFPKPDTRWSFGLPKFDEPNQIWFHQVMVYFSAKLN